MRLLTGEPAADTRPDLGALDLYPAALYGNGDAHAAWARLRADEPYFRQEAPGGTPFWSVTRHADVEAVLLDADTYSSEHSTMLTVLDRDAAAGRAIHLVDPPGHAALRRPTAEVLSMRRMRPGLSRAKDRIEKLVRSHATAAEVDFAELVRILPMAVAGEVLGIPEPYWADAGRWTVASMAAEDPAFGGGDAADILLEAHIGLLSMFDQVLRDETAAPDTLIGALHRVQVDSRPLTRDEVLVNCYAFIMGANPTVPQAAAQLVLLAAEQPELWQRIRRRETPLTVVTEELLRWASPVNHVLRRTKRETVLGGHVLAPGTLVAAWLASANRDSSVFDDPWTFRPDRRPNPHVAFGVGAHTCVGNAAARVALHALVDVLAATVERVELAGPVGHLHSNFLNGVTSLPVRLYPADA
ncbi:Cytochrome P450 [Jatrophihabitans endophyticus]|uniref:Cytochrome P450 n=1 Tax=Jatrophihabitans endophyticus TaxID=1206085 RepID=A0A1M5CQF7_9ACTN|nr:cytochrome P450 [Jatrophihabitans endophyticus]SHF56857.1 Cytochrome P450 [Jatrophihabitans endophyticus]